jgi:hypothetical protein
MSELSRETRDLLERGREGVPLSQRHRARLKGAVWAQVSVASVATTATSAAAWSLAKVIGLGALVTVASVGTTAGILHWRAEHSAQSARGSSVSNGSPPSIAPSAATVGSEATPSEASEPKAPTAEDRTHRRDVGRSVPSAAKTAEPSPIPAATAEPGPEAPAASLESADSLAVEARLLRDADRALKAGDAVESLRILDVLAARIPNGSLGPERSAERVFALCRAGRTSDAQAEASAFVRAHPGGPLAARVRASCGGIVR